MQQQECFVSSAFYSFWAHRLGTLLGTLEAFFARSVQKTEGKRVKATVLLTAAFGAKLLAAAAAQRSSRAEPTIRR